MEIVIQTKKNIWSISRKGINKVSTFDWKNMKQTIEALFNYQAAEAKKANNAPVLQAINKTVERGAASARANDQAWRDRKRREKEEPEGDFSIEALHGRAGWDTQDKRTEHDRVQRALDTMPLK